jgi:hypothetical protein
MGLTNSTHIRRFSVRSLWATGLAIGLLSCDTTSGPNSSDDALPVTPTARLHGLAFDFVEGSTDAEVLLDCADPDFDLAFASVEFAVPGTSPLVQQYEIAGRASTVPFRWTVTASGLITGVCRDGGGLEGSDELTLETSGR